MAASVAEAVVPAERERVARWVASVSAPAADCRLSVVTTSRLEPELSARPGDVAVLFEGVLYNRRDLIDRLDVSEPIANADLVAVAYERWDRDVVHQLKGIYAITIADRRQRHVLAIRDPLGAFPLFYAEARGSILTSTSADALREQPGVDRGVNREALSDHLCHRWADQDETFFAGVRRVPPGYALFADSTGLRVSRYWEPVPAGRPVNWLKEDEFQDRFDRLFEQAVDRTLGGGRTGLFLSGGLDSISVGAMAADLLGRQQRPLPIALSLGFPNDADEERGQRGVAKALGVEHEFVPFNDATANSGLLSKALDQTRLRPAPVINTWVPAYIDLAQRGKRRGVETILSGAGGDEWMAVSPFIAADLLRARQVRQLATLVAGWKRSYTMSTTGVLKCLLWTFGARPLAGAAIERMAPRLWGNNRVGRSVNSILPWVAPDAGLKQSMVSRAERLLPTANPPAGFYLQDIRASLEHPLTSMELEEVFESGRALNVRFLHPYWDAEIVDILYRTPPLFLFSGGRSKSVVRDTMARRFSGLGLDRQKKVNGTSFYTSVLDTELPDLWRRHRDLGALGDLGVVDTRKAAAMADGWLERKSSVNPVRIWDLINLETWVRAHN